MIQQRHFRSHAEVALRYRIGLNRRTYAPGPGGSGLAEYPRIPVTVIAERLRWPHTLNPLRIRNRDIRPEYVGIDAVDRVSDEPGQTAQCDLWFPETRIPVPAGQQRILPVLVMTLGFSRFMSATMIPSRQSGDLLSGMWRSISSIGRVPKTLCGTGKLRSAAAAG